MDAWTNFKNIYNQMELVRPRKNKRLTMKTKKPRRKRIRSLHEGDVFQMPDMTIYIYLRMYGVYNLTSYCWYVVALNTTTKEVEELENSDFILREIKGDWHISEE